MNAFRDAPSSFRAWHLVGETVLLPSSWEDGKIRSHVVAEIDPDGAFVIPMTHRDPGTRSATLSSSPGRSAPMASIPAVPTPSCPPRSARGGAA